MNAKANPRKMVSNFSKVLMVAVALIILVSAFPTGKASAWYYAPPIVGRPGGVSISPIYVGDLLMPTGVTAFTLYNSSNAGPIVSRSPAAGGPQTVGAIYSVEKWDGVRWVTVVKSAAIVRTISATQTNIRFPAAYLQPTSARGYFRVSWAFAWTSSTGVSLGAVVVNSDRINDHICVTPIRVCQPYAGYVSVP